MSAYFFFIFTLLYAVRNVENIAANPTVHHVMEKVSYNLRDIPRVNYKELSSDDEDEQVTNSNSEEKLTRRRRDRNAYSRILEVPN